MILIILFSTQQREAETKQLKIATEDGKTKNKPLLWPKYALKDIVRLWVTALCFPNFDQMVQFHSRLRVQHKKNNCHHSLKDMFSVVNYRWMNR